MQEKRLRKQELEEQARGSAEAEPLQKRTAERTLKKKAPARGSSSHTEASTPKIPVRKLISLKSKSAASSLTRADSQSPNSSKEKPHHQSKACVNVKPAGAAEEPEQEQPADPKGTDTSLTTITALNRRLYPDRDPENSLRLRVAAFEYLIILLKITSNN